jgi:glycosyltransferase involved in cell wall biosynthesis
MKVLWVSHFLPYPPKGGALQRSHHLLTQAARRHEVHLVSLNQKNLLPSPQSANEAKIFLRNLCTRVDVFPIPSDSSRLRWGAMTMASYFRSSTYDVNWLRNREMTRFMSSLSRTETYDLLHVDTIGLYPYAAAFSRTPVVLNHHNIESHMMRRRYEKERHPGSKLYFHREFGKIRRYEQRVCSRCAVNLVVSELDGTRLKETAGDVRVSVIPNGVDVDYFQPQVPVEESRSGLIFAGAMDWYPNREAARFFIREIWPLLQEENRERRVTFLGKNPPRELVEAAADPAIRVPGFVDDVRPYMNQARIYVCPIRDGGGTRLKILDALAMGMPVVATGLAVEGLDLVEEVHYLRAEAAGDFVLQIHRLENDPGLCLAISSAGRSFVQERFSWEVIGETLARAYRQAKNSSGTSHCDLERR